MGDFQGHPFHGNQWTTGQAGHAVPQGTKPGRSSAEYPPMNGSGRDTQARFSTKTDRRDGLGSIRRYTPERQALHDEIISKFLTGTLPVRDPIATVLGGGPASGKSSGFEVPDNTVHVDPDQIRQMLPEYQEQVGKNKEIAGFTHEEASDIAKQITRVAAENNRNVLLDGTGDGSIESLVGKLSYLRSHDFRVVGRYTVLEPETALARMKTRAENPKSPNYGRYIHEAILLDTHAGVARVLPAAIRAKAFDSIEVYENNGKAPRLILSGSRHGQDVIHDPAAWRSFTEGRGGRT